MKKKIIYTAMILLVLTGVTALGIAQVKALSLEEQRTVYSLPWSVIGAGGMGGSAGSFTIHSTLGQPVAGDVDGGTYHLTSGFWTEVLASIEEYFSFLQLILR